MSGLAIGRIYVAPEDLRAYMAETARIEALYGPADAPREARMFELQMRLAEETLWDCFSVAIEPPTA